MADSISLVLFVPSAIWLIRIIAHGLSNGLVVVDVKWFTLTSLSIFAMYSSAVQLRSYAAIAALLILFLLGASLFNGITMKNDEGNLEVHKNRRMIKSGSLIILGVCAWLVAASLIIDL